MSSATGLIFLDVAVPMYAAGRPHPFMLASRWIMAEIAAGRLHVAIDTETIQEVLHRYASLQRFSDAGTVANELLTIVPRVLPVTAADVQAPVLLFRQYAPQGVPSRDIVHAAVMQNNGIAQIITPDCHFDKIAGIMRLDPLQLHMHAGQPTP